MTLLLHTHFTSVNLQRRRAAGKSFALLCLLGWHKVSIFGFYCCGWLPLHNISFSLIDLSSAGWTTRSCTHRLLVRLASSAFAAFTFACGLAHYLPFRCLFFLLCGEGGMGLFNALLLLLQGLSGQSGLCLRGSELD
jgi:hypothetical protein